MEFLTAEEKAQLEAKLAAAKAKRPEFSERIAEARALGDLKENAEYHAAKEKQGMIEARIAELEDKISRAEVIDTSKLNGHRVAFGAWVTLEDVDNESEVTYRIVGADESDLDKGTISVTSPIARAMINREAGDEVRVKAPGGLRTYEIVSIRWNP